MNNIIIGVDLGGTKIMTGAIDATDGRIIGTPIKIATQSQLPKEQIVENIAQSIRQVMRANGLQKQDVVGVGVGSTGPLDLDLGLVLDCPQLPTMQHFALRETLQQAVGLPVALNNDANCLVLGEAVFGAARNKRTVLGFTLGTGIGCALVVDGKIWNGATGTAGEIWCSPHGKGIIEDAISGQGVANIYKQIAHTDASSLEVYQRARRTPCARRMGNLWPTSSRALGLVYQPHRPRCGFAWWLHCHRPSLLYACHDAQFAGAHLSVARPTHTHCYGIVGRQRWFCGRSMPYARSRLTLNPTHFHNENKVFARMPVLFYDSARRQQQPKKR